MSEHLTSFQSGQIVAIKKVALKKIEDGIPNTALREIKALREIEDNPFVSIWRSVRPQLILYYDDN